jgi:RNA polymerase sigma-70 factor, ECF subfamily
VESQNSTELIEKISRGDRGSFTNLYRQNYANLCEFAFWYTGNADAAKDIVHEVFLKIWENRDNWKPNIKIRPYLYKAVKNEALNYLKHQKVIRNWEDKSRHFDAVKVITPEEHCIGSELRVRINKALNQLPEKRRYIFLLNRDYGLSYREISEILDLSINTVETQIRRTLKKLNELLRDFL